MNFDLHTHKHHIISLQYLQHKWLPEKSSLHCLRIPIMFKDLAVIMKEIIPWLLAWLNLTIPNQTVRNSLKAKNIKLPQNDFFLQNQLIKFSCTYWPPSFCKILKNFYGRSRVMRMCHFRAQNEPFVMNNIFWYKPLLLSSTYWLFSLCRILIKRIQSYEDAPFLGPKWSICPK